MAEVRKIMDFASPIESIELLEYEGVELLLIAARAKTSLRLGEGRGNGKHAAYCATSR